MPACLAQYREDLRMLLSILTPKEKGVPGAQAGDEPSWDPEPSNAKLNNFIKRACSVINQQAGLSVDSKMRTLAVAAQTAVGPCPIGLDSIPGYPPRSIIGIRRAWWDAGSGPVRLDPVFLNSLDLTLPQYQNDPVSTPVRFAIEGNTLFLSPPPGTAGTLSFMASTGLLAPRHDDEPYTGIPEAYDEAVNFVALDLYAKSQSSDAEMVLRAQAFTSDAAAGLERLIAWFQGDSNPQAEARMIFDAAPFRRNSRMR